MLSKHVKSRASFAYNPPKRQSPSIRESQWHLATVYTEARRNLLAVNWRLTDVF